MAENERLGSLRVNTLHNEIKMNGWMVGQVNKVADKATGASFIGLEQSEVQWSEVK